MSTSLYPAGAKPSLWDFTREFHDRFLQKVVNQSSAGTGARTLFQAIRELASIHPGRRLYAKTTLHDIIHGLFNDPPGDFLKQFDATWGVVLLWDDFHNSFINTEGFHNFVDPAARALFEFGATLITEQEIFVRRGFTEPMTELIFRATTPPRPLLLAWPLKKGNAGAATVVGDLRPSSPVQISFAELSKEPLLRDGWRALRQEIVARGASGQASRLDTEWLAQRIQDLAKDVLKKSETVCRIIGEQYKHLLDIYGSPAIDPDRMRALASSLQTLIWNRLFDDEWQFLYFIPAQLPGPRTVSGLVLACRNELHHPQYTALLEMVNRVLSVFHFGLYGYQRDRFALQAAVTAVMARNMSHNIGSHVLPRTHNDQIRARLFQLAPHHDEKSAAAIVGSLRDRLSSFVQAKADFLSEITTEPLTSTRPAMFFNEVILPLLDNPLIMDNLAANEGIRYASGANDMTTGCLRIRVFMLRKGGKPVEMSVRYGCAPAECKKAGCYRDAADPSGQQSMPAYDGRCPNNPQTVLTPTVLNSENDVQVDLPGPLGEYAFYGFLENLIRNAAKHNRTALVGRNLTIDVTIAEGSDPAFYEIVVSDDVSDPDAKTPGGVDLHDDLRERLKQTLTEADGQIRRAGWGLREMQVCAALLGGVSDFVTLTTESPLEVRSKDGRLEFVFRLMRSQNVLALLPNGESWTISKADDLLRKGVRICRSWQEFDDALDRSQRRSARFAVFSVEGYGDIDKEREFVGWLERALPRLPLRVLVFDPGDRFGGPPDLRGEVELPTGVGVIRSPIEEGQWLVLSALMESLWSSWLDRWLVERTTEKQDVRPGISVGSERRNTASVNIYLQQAAGEQPTARWVEHAIPFNQASHSVQVRVGGQTSGLYRTLTPLLPVLGGPEIMYDRHSDMLVGTSDTTTNKALTHLTLAKDSPDFIALFAGSFPAVDDKWLFPYELAEAGLLRILVIDERIAEASYEKAPDANKDLATQKWGDMLRARGAPEGVSLEIRRWHVGWLANVFICTHFGFKGSLKPIHPRIEAALSDPYMPYLSVDIGANGAAFKLAPFPEDAAVEAEPVFDIVLIHQGVLDNWCGAETPRCLEILRSHVGAVVVESGRGMPMTLPAGERFLPFSVIQHYLMGPHIGKLGLTRSLMSLARSGSPGHA